MKVRGREINYNELLEAFKEKKVKTKHLKRKAEKKRKTRSIKISDAKQVDSAKEAMRRRLDRATSDTLRNIASHSEVASEIKKLKGQIRQILS